MRNNIHFLISATLVVAYQQGSSSLLQRKLGIGYNQAGEIMDQLEMKGIVGPFRGSEGRVVNITDLRSLEKFLSKKKISF